MHQIVKNTHLKYTPKAILNQTQTKYKKMEWNDKISVNHYITVFLNVKINMFMYCLVYAWLA